MPGAKVCRSHPRKENASRRSVSLSAPSARAEAAILKADSHSMSKECCWVASGVSHAVSRLFGVTHHEDPSVAQPQPKLGISPAKPPRPQRSEKMVKIFRKNIYLFPPNLASLRLCGRHIRESIRPFEINSYVAE